MHAPFRGAAVTRGERSWQLLAWRQCKVSRELAPPKNRRRIIPRLFYTPRRTAGPLAQRLAGPLRRLVGMARIAGIGHLILYRRRRRNEFESVRADVYVG